MKTRAQEDLILAERLVSEVEDKSENIRKIYGGLCHSFPVMVRTCGLCQSLAFSTDKATVTGTQESDRNTAHRLLLEHAAKLLTGQSDREALMKKVRGDDALAYMRDTRRVLSAWVYFKRFAVSILKVEDTRADQEARYED